MKASSSSFVQYAVAGSAPTHPVKAAPPSLDARQTETHADKAKYASMWKSPFSQKSVRRDVPRIISYPHPADPTMTVYRYHPAPPGKYQVIRVAWPKLQHTPAATQVLAEERPSMPELRARQPLFVRPIEMTIREPVAERRETATHAATPPVMPMPRHNLPGQSPSFPCVRT